MNLRLEKKIDYFLYYILQNRFSWNLLTLEWKEKILEINETHNNTRFDYLNPNCYGIDRTVGGENFDSLENRLNFSKGQVLDQILKNYTPNSILEIGPGAGFFSKQIIHYDFVHYYSACDIQVSFLEFLKKRLEQTVKDDILIDINFYLGTIKSIPENKKFDGIIYLSSMHHIPDRKKELYEVTKRLNPEGVLIIIEPTHYIPRLFHLLLNTPKYISNKYMTESFFCATHHYLTINEVKAIVNFCNLKINFFVFFDKWHIIKNIPLLKNLFMKPNRFSKFFYEMMAVVIKKNDLL